MDLPKWAQAALRASEQHGVITVSQLHACGISPASIQHAARSGRLHRIHHGVYALGHSPRGLRSHLIAATLACGPRSATSHRSAGELIGLLSPTPHPVEVMVASHAGRSRRGLRIHRMDGLRSDEVHSVAMIPCTTVARTIVDLAGRTERELKRAVREAENRNLLKPAEVQRLLTRHPYSTGKAQLEMLLDLRDPLIGMTRSDLELAFFELCRRAGLVLPEVNAVVIANGRKYEVDFLWRDLGLLIETDGRKWHSGRYATSLDEVRDRDLTIAGWRVARLTWRQVMLDPEGTVATVRALITQQNRLRG